MTYLGKLQPRRRSVPVNVGGVFIGGEAPVIVQSMTNTDTADAEATAQQVAALARAGSELVRITVDRDEAAAAVPRIRDRQFAEMIEIALKNGKAVRIGVNWGSLDEELLTRLMDENSRQARPRDAADVMREAIVQSALGSAARAEDLGLGRDRIILSAKVSGVQELIGVYAELASRSDHALHLGLTEAGMGAKGIVASAAALGVLLEQGIGDTIRVSLTPQPGGPRTEEVVVAQQILQTMGLRSFAPVVAACPGCGRTTSSVFQELAQEIQGYVLERMPQWRARFPGAETLKVAVMGCIVNGPGESRHADIGISLPGTGEEPVAPVFIDGKKVMTLRGAGLASDFKAVIEEYVERRYGGVDEKDPGAACV